MSTDRIFLPRLRYLVDLPPRPRRKYVLYWMQQSQRTRFNHALEYAVTRANELDLPVVVCFGLTDRYPDANARHYAFMLEGLADVEKNLRARNIRFVAGRGEPPDVAARYADNAAVVVCDRGYLRHQKAWREKLASWCERAGIPLVQLESDVVVPVEIASNKRESAARTLRPKIHRHLAEHMAPLPQMRLQHSSLHLRLPSDFMIADPLKTLAELKVNRSVQPATAFFRGGQEEAQRRLADFVARVLPGYREGRNEPAADQTSHLSAYLHFGQISPVEITLRVQRASASAEDREAFLEELIVRRELACNFCQFTENYDAYEALPPWAKQTLKDHQSDTRPYTYTRAQLESAQTHDPYWNAAQKQMNLTGFMHNYMRMYWGKKILEWMADSRQAYETILHLNNRLFLCGRDPVSYASVGWIFGLHDRPWGPARKIFGTVRYMNSAGLERKFDMDAYVAWVNQLHR